MQAWIKSLSKPVRKYGWLIIFIIILLSISTKPIKFLILQSRAGKTLDEYIQIHAKDYEDFYSCQIPLFISLPEDERLAKSISFLEQARVLYPQNAQLNLLLGHAYCLQEDYESAIVSFDKFTQQRANNPLGALESAFAHFSLILTDKGISDTEKITHESKTRILLSKAGYTGEHFIQEADSAFNRWSSPAYEVAWYWYRIAEIFQPLSEENQFRTLLLDLAYLDKAIDKSVMEDEYVLLLTELLTISPNSFIRLADGASVSVREVGGRSASLYFQNRDTGVIILNVQEDGHYCMSVNAFDRAPKPTLIEVSLNLKPIMMIELTNEDDMWVSFEGDFFLEKGQQLLGLRLTNDDNVNGIDRNGYVGEIILHVCD